MALVLEVSIDYQSLRIGKDMNNDRTAIPIHIREKSHKNIEVQLDTIFHVLSTNGIRHIEATPKKCIQKIQSVRKSIQ